MKNFLSVIWSVIWKDFKTEWRGKEQISSMLVFALLVIIIFNFSLELDLPARESVISGVLWVTFAFAGTIGINRSLSSETDQGGLQALLLAPVDRSYIYLGKLVGNFSFMLVTELIVIPVYSFLYQVNLFKFSFFLVVVLGSLGYTAVGTLLAVMTVQTRTRDILLPILLFPLTLPMLIPAVKASQILLDGSSIIEANLWVNLLLVYNLIFLTLAVVLFEYVVEE